MNLFLASLISIFLKQLQWELDKFETSNFFLSWTLLVTSIMVNTDSKGGTFANSLIIVYLV